MRFGPALFCFAVIALVVAAPPAAAAVDVNCPILHPRSPARLVWECASTAIGLVGEIIGDGVDM